MTRFSGGPGMPNHILVIDEAPGGFAATCIPHGALGGPCPTYLAAVLRACEHDNRYGKDWL